LVNAAEPLPALTVSQTTRTGTGVICRLHFTRSTWSFPA
jgi:hypothetical protein